MTMLAWEIIVIIVNMDIIFIFVVIRLFIVIIVICVLIELIDSFRLIGLNWFAKRI